MSVWQLTSLQTPRLILRPLDDHDIPGLVALNDDPLVWRFTGDGPVDAAKARAILDDVIRPQYARGVGRLAVEPRSEPGVFWGWCGLKYLGDVDVDHSGPIPSFDLGYRILPAARGAGVASEAALAVVDAAVKAVAVSGVAALIIGRAHVDNTASRRVLDTCGLRFVGTADDDGMPVALYERHLRA